MPQSPNQKQRTSLGLDEQQAAPVQGPPKTVDYCEELKLLAIHGFDDKGNGFSRIGFKLGDQFYAFQSALPRKSITVPLTLPWLVEGIDKALKQQELLVKGTTEGADVKTGKAGGIPLADLTAEGAGG
jgi:hypothetical protein